MLLRTSTLLAYSLPLHGDWPGASMHVAVRNGWLLRIETGDGRCGFGECAPLPSHGSEPAAAAGEALRQWSAALCGKTLNDAGELLAAAATFATPAARAAVDTALLDLAAQQAGVPLWRHLGTPAGDGSIAVNALTGDVMSVTSGQIAATLAAGFTTIKLKLGVADAGSELAALLRLAPLLPPRTRLRLDANRAWDADTAARFCAALAGLPIESLEEPLAEPTPAALAALQRELPFALAVDESWLEFDREEFFAAPPVRRLVLKPAVHGGLRPALDTARRAQAAGVDCVVTTGVDSACGTFAAAHLAAAVDQQQRRRMANGVVAEQANGLAHGLATSSWLAADTGEPPPVAGGRIALPATPGLGFVPRLTRAGCFPSR